MQPFYDSRTTYGQGRAMRDTASKSRPALDLPVSEIELKSEQHDLSRLPGTKPL